MLHDKYDVVLVIDESGSLGFSTKQEQTPGQFGLIAGYLIPFSELNDAKVLAKSYFQEFKQEDEKIHSNPKSRFSLIPRILSLNTAASSNCKSRAACCMAFSSLAISLIASSSL